MPTYNVKHKETGETKEFRMTIKDYEQWRIDNPDWDKDWTAGVASMGEVGDWRDKMRKHILVGQMSCVRLKRILIMDRVPNQKKDISGKLWQLKRRHLLLQVCLRKC